MKDLFRNLQTGILFEASEDMYPSKMHSTTAGAGFQCTERTSHSFGYVTQGPLELTSSSFKGSLNEGHFFSVPGAFKIQGSGSAVIFERIGYRGLSYISWGLEQRGRLAYIDDCSVTQVFPPVRSGDPTLQALFFPPSIRQTMHTHPTLRFGLVIGGHGECVFPSGTVPLEKGMAFHLPPLTPHCFHSSAQGLSVIAFHPDSEEGPKDHSHPMLSRTYIK